MSKIVTFQQANRLVALGYNIVLHCSCHGYECIGCKSVNLSSAKKLSVSDALYWVRDEKGIECGVYPIMIPIRDGLKRMAYAHSAFDLNNNCKRLQLDISLVKIDTHNLASSALLDAVLTYLEQK